MSETKDWKTAVTDGMLLLDRAIVFAAVKHSGAMRKETSIPYVTHVIETMEIVSRMTEDEEIRAAAVLHDTLEDTKTTKEELERNFGKRVADLVEAESENKRAGQPEADTWLTRKKETIQHLSEAQTEIRMIALGDKLSNTRAMHRDFTEIGKKLWKRFNKKDPGLHAYYYLSLMDVFGSDETIRKTPEYREYAALCGDLFGKADPGSSLNNEGWRLHQEGREDEAAEWYQEAARFGNTTAMVNLGNNYENREDYEKAYEWYLEAALAGDVTGMFNVANMHYWGWHVRQDYQKAWEYFKRLYELDVDGTCLYMGLYAENGFIDEKDYKKAAAYYREGVDKEEEYCAVNLGRMYCLGLGMEKNEQKGFEFYLLGYRQGDILACANLGYCYEVGQGVQKDMAKALSYYEEGAAKGEEHCAEALERLKAGENQPD